MNNNLQGRGFWHNDGDRGGYRMYLNYENFDKDYLLLRKTKEPYTYDDYQYICEKQINCPAYFQTPWRYNDFG